MPDKNGFPHFMLKEIFEQPKGLEDTISPRVSLEDVQVRLADQVRISAEELRALRRINIGHQSSCGNGRPVHDSGNGPSAGRCGLRQ